MNCNMEFLFILSCLICVSAEPRPTLRWTHNRLGDSSPHPKPGEVSVPRYETVCEDSNFKCKWIAQSGNIYDEKVFEHMLEVGATHGIPKAYHQAGAETVAGMLVHLDTPLFEAICSNGAVGLFTWEDATTIFPEYNHLRDRPECQGTCSGACANTCTSDGRKYDSLAGLGGSRGTCVDENFMCTQDDPYDGMTNILVHEFAHTLHGYGVAIADPWLYNDIYNTYINAWYNEIWTLGSYAMVNEYEYWAEATGVFFNVNHYSASGGMNSCGRPPGEYCETEEEGRSWLQSRDPLLYSTLTAAFSSQPGQVDKCPSH